MPDPDMVWRCAILLEDYKGQKQLSVQFEEDGEVTPKAVFFTLVASYTTKRQFFWHDANMFVEIVIVWRKVCFGKYHFFA